MPAYHPLQARLAAAWNPEGWQQLDVLLAISGGADSVALLRAVAAIKTAGAGRLIAAHFNHRLRGAQSDADEAFVVDLCAGLGIVCEVDRAPPDSLSNATGDGLEAASRAARYDFLKRTANRLGARYVLTAHTADDQVETVLHHILRGTGIAGLAGMSPARPLGEAATLLRPFLAFRRVELVAYLDDLGQSYCADPSNEDPRFTRNRIRHQLLPLLAEEFYPSVDQALLRLAALAAEVQQVMDRLVADLADRCVFKEGTAAIRIRTVDLADQPRYLVRELLIAAWREQGWPMQAMGFVQWDLLATMLLDPASGPQKQVLPGAVTAHRRPDDILLSATAIL